MPISTVKNLYLCAFPRSYLLFRFNLHQPLTWLAQGKIENISLRQHIICPGDICVKVATIHTLNPSLKRQHNRTLMVTNSVTLKIYYKTSAIFIYYHVALSLHYLDQKYFISLDHNLVRQPYLFNLSLFVYYISLKSHLPNQTPQATNLERNLSHRIEKV